MKPLSEIINSEADARLYWTTLFGEPEYFSSFDELRDIDDMLEKLKAEKSILETEISHRDVKYMNEFKINRAIELHFLIECGIKYLDECSEEAIVVEKDLEHAYAHWQGSVDDDLFTRDYLEN